MESHEELFSLAKRLEAAATPSETEEFAKPLNALNEAARRVERAFSGSWLGYHSRVYYSGLQPVPPGARFSQEWGFYDTIGPYGTQGDWREFSTTDILDYIEQLAGNPDLSIPREMAQNAEDTFNSAKSDLLSIIENETLSSPDKFVDNIRREIENLELVSTGEVVKRLAPNSSSITRDMVALNQGNQPPPHIGPIAEVIAIGHAMGTCRLLAEKATKLASHLERRKRRKRADDRVGTNVFIGHGRSLLWRELKDFVGERLGLPYDEFNRVPVAGVTNVARLSEMLEAASIAFLVMTAEDEMADGGLHARMNVIHEAGLFQGRLGFGRAIVLLEEGCAEFSNIQGLGQIRFPRGNIGASFEEVRRVLERESLIDA